MQLTMDRAALVGQSLERIEDAALLGADKRIRIVCVTNKGRKLVDGAEPKWRQAQEALIETIGEDRWRAMCTLLRDTARMVRHRAVTAD
jgi:hypothetical protein